MKKYFVTLMIGLNCITPHLTTAQTNLIESQPKVIFATGFEAVEGYDLGITLAGQNGWVVYGGGGNGLVTNFFPNLGQQAFIGYTHSKDTNDIVNIWRPINYPPEVSQQSNIRFSTLMMIVDSSNQQFDDFRWSVYNPEGQRLFSLDFDNRTLLSSFALDDEAGFISTGVLFQTNVIYELTILMDFGHNWWNAWLGTNILAQGQPITTQNATRKLGDVDAVWALRTPGKPGDNYMVFDNYRIEVPGQQTPLPKLESVSRLENGAFLLRLIGDPLNAYAIDVSTNMVDWVTLKTNSTASDGVFDFLDVTASVYDRSFYRARLVKP